MNIVEKGYYHPSRGYWQTIGIPSGELLESYPEGTVEVPLMPGAGYTYDGTQWVPPSAAEASAQLAAQVRGERDRLLKASDWTQVADAPVDQPAWATYRQALRDIPQQAGFPETITWPQEP